MNEQEANINFKRRVTKFQTNTFEQFEYFLIRVVKIKIKDLIRVNFTKNRKCLRDK